jgi:hypothetical protein
MGPKTTLPSFKALFMRLLKTTSMDLPVTVWSLTSVHPEMVDFGSGQGLSVFATDGAAVTALAGIVRLFRKTVNGRAIIAKKRKRRMDTN